jgi:hypothetical protein
LDIEGQQPLLSFRKVWSSTLFQARTRSTSF